MTAKLEQELTKLKQGDHICLIYENSAEQMATAVPFLKEGLARGERCLYVADDRTVEAIAQTLAATGVDVAYERKRGALWMLTEQDTYLKEGKFDPQMMIDFLRSAQTEALANDFSGFRVAAEMTWALGPETGWNRLIGYEALLNDFLANSRSVILCQYNHSRFESALIHDVLRTHPIAVLGDLVCPNPYYEPAELVLSSEPQANAEFKRKRVEWWIAQLKRARVAEQEREQVLEKLKQSERRLAEAQQVAHIGSWERDLRTNQVTWSDELFHIFALKADKIDLSYEQFLNLLELQDRDRVRALVDEAIRDRRHFSTDYRLNHADGSVHVVHDRGGVILDEVGEPIRLVGTAQDVTEFRQAEQALKEAHNLLRAVIEGIPDAVYVKDLQGRYVMMNASGARMIGKEVSDVLGRDDAALFESETARRFSETDRQVMESGSTETFEDSGTAANVTRDYLSAKSPFWAADGEVRGVLGISRDITEQKQAAEELNRQKVILQTIFDNIPVMINFVDTAGRAEIVNKHWERVLGRTLEEAQGRDLLPEFYPDPEYRARVIEYIQDPTPGWTELEMRVRGGRRIDTSWALSVLPDGTRIWFGQDITERKQARQTLENYATRLQTLSRRLLEVQEEERRHLARELHDEVGQMLTGLRLALKPTGDLTADSARAGFEQARSLVDALLDLVRQLSFDLRPAALDQLGLLPGLLGLLERYTKQTGVLVNFKHQEVDRRFPPEVETTAYRIVQEALTNVARHATVGVVTVRVWATADTLSLQVEDRGRGFDPEVALASSLSMGLAGMQERVMLLDGHLTIQAKPGAGTQLTAELPLSGQSLKDTDDDLHHFGG